LHKSGELHLADPARKRGRPFDDSATALSIAIQHDQFGPCDDRTPEAGIGGNWMEDGPERRSGSSLASSKQHHRRTDSSNSQVVLPSK
jgi:hypothetical protein